MFKDLPPNLVAAVAAINQTSRAAFMVEQDALRNKKLMQPPIVVRKEEVERLNEVHVLDDEGETHVHVKDAKNVRELDRAVAHHLKKHHGFSHQDVEDYYHDGYYSNVPDHHEKPEKGSKPTETRTKEEHAKSVAERVAQMKKDNEMDEGWNPMDENHKPGHVGFKKLMQPPMPKQPAPKADPAAHPGAKKMAEGATMSRAAKGHEKYGKEGMQALAKAGRDGKDLGKIRDKYNKYDESVTEAEGTLAKTPREKELAAKHGHPKRITFGDVLKARGVTRQEAVLHPNQQKLDVHEPDKDELTAKDFKMLRANKKPKSEGFNPLKHIVNPSPAVKTAAKDVKRGSYADRAALMKAGGVKDDRGPRGVTKEEVSQDMTEGSFYGNDKMAKAAQDMGDSKSIVRMRDAKGTYTANMFRKQGEKNPKEISRVYDKEDVKEEVEELDEYSGLSKTTLGSYAKKATRDAVITRKIGADFEHQSKRAKSPGMKAASDELSQKWKEKSWKRRDGVDKAVDRLTKEEVEQTQEGWNDMMQASQARAEKEKTAKGTGKFNKQVVSTGTVYTRKASTFDDGGGKDADERKVDRTRRSALKQEAFTPSLSFKYYVEATGPNHLHVSDAGNNKYKVHSVGSNFSNGIKVGEHLTDTHLDDFTDMGGKITHVKPTANKAQPK